MLVRISLVYGEDLGDTFLNATGADGGPRCCQVCDSPSEELDELESAPFRNLIIIEGIGTREMITDLEDSYSLVDRLSKKFQPHRFFATEDCFDGVVVNTTIAIGPAQALAELLVVDEGGEFVLEGVNQKASPIQGVHRCCQRVR